MSGDHQGDATETGPPAGSEFGVWNEWGTLRQVAVGTLDGMVVPEDTDSFFFMSPDERGPIASFGGQSMEELLAGPAPDELKDLLGHAQEELDNLADVYAGHLGSDSVFRPRPLTREELASTRHVQDGFLAIYPADPIWIIGRHAVECQFRAPFRNKEVWSLRELVAPLVEADPRARVAALPASLPRRSTVGAPGPYLEGGDILIVGNDDKDVLVGVDDRSSNAAGVEWLRRYLSDDGYRVTPVRYRSFAYHLLSVMCIVREGLGIVLPGSVDQIPAALHDWEFIEISLEECQRMGLCNVMLDRDTMLVPDDVPVVSAELDRRGVNVLPVPFRHARAFGGGIRCSTFVMQRSAA